MKRNVDSLIGTELNVIRLVLHHQEGRDDSAVVLALSCNAVVEK